MVKGKSFTAMLCRHGCGEARTVTVFLFFFSYAGKGDQEQEQIQQSEGGFSNGGSEMLMPLENMMSKVKAGLLRRCTPIVEGLHQSQQSFILLLYYYYYICFILLIRFIFNSFLLLHNYRKIKKSVFLPT